MRRGVGILTIGFLAAGIAAFILSCGGQGARSSKQTAADTTTAAAAVIVNEQGQEAFLADCAMCHGERGGGDGPLAPILKEQKGAAVPARLDDRARLDQLGRDGLRAVVAKGGAHTGRSNLMPAWGEKLEPALIDSIVDFVMALPDIAPGTPAATIAKYLAAPPGTPEEGRKLFVYYCSGCHGPYGKGDGVNAEALRLKHNVRPRNLTDSTYFAPKSDQQLYTTVALGGGHVGKSIYMPAWTYTLSPEQIKNVVSYVRAISRTPSKP